MQHRHPGYDHATATSSTRLRRVLDRVLARSNSDETLVTQHEYGSHNYDHNHPPERHDVDYSRHDRAGDLSDLTSLLTTGSDETLTNNVKILGQPISSYTVRELPIVSTFLQPGVLIFPSLQSLDVYTEKNLLEDETEKYRSQGLGVPLLQTSTPMLSIFKINSPLMVIYRYTHANQKSVFCKVYFRILTTNVTCYILIFRLDTGGLKTVVLMNNGIKPSVDFVYRSTKVRVTGVTGTTSTFANGLIQLYILQDPSPMLCDDMVVHNTLETINSSIKHVKVSVGEPNALYKALRFQKKATLTKLMNEGKALINTPLATFVDNGDEKIKGLNLFRNGTIKIFETANDGENNTDTLIITTILLVLREQEFRKIRGNNKPTFVNHHNN